MLELIFQGFLEWTYGLILECWEYFSSVLFDLMSLDFAYRYVVRQYISMAFIAQMALTTPQLHHLWKSFDVTIPNYTF